MTVEQTMRDGIPFWRYWWSNVLRALKAMSSRLEWFCVAVMCVLLTLHRHGFTQGWISFRDMVLSSLEVVATYFAVHLLRAPWKTYLETVNGLLEERAVQTSAIERLTTTAQELKSRIGRPYVVLRFVPPPPPPKPYYDAETKTFMSEFRASEFTVVNPSDQDAFEIRLPFTELGSYGCAIYSWKTLDLKSKQEARLVYTIVANMGEGAGRKLFEYEHNLKPLLDKVFERVSESPDEAATFPLTLLYKNAAGQRFESQFVLTHHPQIWHLPKVESVVSFREGCMNSAPHSW